MKWYNSGTDICAEYAHGNYGVLQEYVKSNSGMLIGGRIDEDDDFITILKLGRSIMKRFQQRCLIDDKLNSIFELGELSGILKLYSHLDYEKSKNEYAWEQSSKLYGSIKNLNEIIIALHQNDSLSQMELADKLGMKASTLTECMKKVLNTNLVLVQRAGKYKIYSLSEYGMRYYDMLMNKRAELDRNAERYSAYYQMIHGLFRKDKEKEKKETEEYFEIRKKEQFQSEFVNSNKNKVVSIEEGKKRKNLKLLSNSNEGKYDDAKEN